MTPDEFEKQFVNTIVCGDAKEIMSCFPDESINCCISSVPYWALRDYGWDTVIVWGSMGDFIPPRKKRERWLIRLKWRAWERGGVFSPNKNTWIGALGLEPTFEMYLDHLCSYYDEIKRILRKDGTCWVNLGDTYNNVTPGGRNKKRWPKQSRNDHVPNCCALPANIQLKSLCLIPQRFAIEMVNRGWILRNVIIWSKPNPMPSSAKDRFTVDFEYVFFFVKSQRYFFEPQYEDAICAGKRGHQEYKGKEDATGKSCKDFLSNKEHYYPLGRNKRTTWIIPTQATPDAHFATFPEELVRPMVKAGCPRYVCKKCGKARKKIYQAEVEYTAGNTYAGKHAKTDPQVPGQRIQRNMRAVRKATGRHDDLWLQKQIGYSDCGCNAGFKPGIMLDPFVARAVPARWRPRRAWTISELTSKKNMWKRSQNQMLKSQIPA